MVAWMIALLALADSAAAQKPGPNSGPSLPSAAELESAAKQIQASSEISPEDKARILEAYKQAESEMAATEAWKARGAELEKTRAGAAERLRVLKAELEKPAEEPQPPDPAAGKLEELEQELLRAQTTLSTDQKSLADLDTARSAHSNRRIDLPGLQGQVRDRARALATTGDPAQGARSAKLTQAQRMLRFIQQRSAEQEAAFYDQEILGFDIIEDLLTAQRDLAARKVSVSEKRVSLLNSAVNERRRLDAEAEAERAVQEQMKAHPAVLAIAEENSRLAARRSGPESFTARIDDAAKAAQAVQRELSQLDEKYKGALDRAKAGGWSNSVGLLLRRQRSELPDLREHRRLIGQRQAEISNIQIEMIDLEEQRARLLDVDARVAEIAAGAPQGTSPAEAKETEAAARRLFHSQRDILDSLIADYKRYLIALADLDASETRLVDRTRRFRSYIDERILWIRSDKTLGSGDVPRLREAAVRFFSPVRWKSVRIALSADATANPLLYGSAVLLLLALLGYRPTVLERLSKAGAEAEHFACGDFSPTLRALGLTGLLVIPPAMLPGYIGWRLSASSGTDEFVKEAGAGFQNAALICVILFGIVQLVRPAGLAEAHFGWRSGTLRYVRNLLYGLSIFILPAGFLIAATENDTGAGEGAVLGRFAFIAGNAALSIFIYQLLHPSGRIAGEFVAHNRGRLVGRSRYVWFTAVFSFPLVLVALAWSGYFYTALELDARLQSSLWLALTLLFADALLARWILTSGRRVVRERAAHMSPEQEESVSGAEASPISESGVFRVPEPASDVTVLNRQTRRLIQSAALFGLAVGLWMIWVDVFPALEMLDHVVLWNRTVKVAAKPTSPGGDAPAQMTEQMVPTTLTALLLAVAILTLTVIAWKNLPALLDLMAPRRVTLDPGVRNTVTSLTRYAIATLGIFVAFGELGIGWGDVQWLAAGLTVGLGFGLQEIFANFISGIILFFERPIRIGDTVTVGGVSGKVTRIHMRTTTITDWDRKELIVPNKEFITGHLVNWTLTDPSVRVILPVGIAYGSDTAVVKSLLLGIARGNAFVIEDPPPQVVFNGFGDNGLNFELRIFVRNLDNLGLIRDLINTEIEKGFRAAGIQIPYPQRDVHVHLAPDAAEKMPPAAIEALTNPQTGVADGED